MSRFGIGFALLALLISNVSFVHAQPKGGDTAWTVDDVVLAEEVGEVHIAPDGKHAVWTKRMPDKDKNELIAHLMLTNLTDKTEIQLTRGQDSALSPRWSPDGKRIAFLFARATPKQAKAKGKREDDEADNEKTQIWLINPFGGEPWVLTDSPRDINAFAWKDNDTVLYAAQEKKSKREADLKEKKDTSEVVEDELNEPPVRLWKVDVKEKKSERFSDNADRIQSIKISPDGRYAVTIHERSLSYTFNHKLKPLIFLYDLETKERKQIFGDKFNIVSVYWQHDSKGLFAINQFTTHPKYLMAYIEELYHFDVTKQAIAKVDLQWPRGLADHDDGFAVTPDGFIALLANGVRHAARRYVKTGDAWKASDFAATDWQAVRVSKDAKTLLTLQSTAVDPSKWNQAKLDGVKISDVTELIDLHADLRKKPMAKTELFRWKGALNEEIEGLVSYPHDFDASKKYPLIVLIHGGPHWADFDHWDERWAYVRNLLCARGAILLRPNYHGSSHYGLAFAESIASKYYMPVEDIEKGIDALVAKGNIDAKKIGLGGWSNGAILTAALITRRHYQAASAGAGGADWATDWGVCDFGMSFSNYYLGKSPFEDPELYRKNAPFYDFPKVKTPTIFFHGSDDKDVPTHHSWYQFRSLREVSKADVRFILFPGEKHGLKKLTHRRRKVEEELAWFDKHLFQNAKPENVALKEDSPLSQALALTKAAKAGRLFGSMKDGVLVPETVKFKELKMGRFEITRAQYAQFDKAYKIEPGSENFPATGMTFEQAKAYCTWLSKVTGTTYRIGTVKEMSAIYEEIDSSENTLDLWAGYKVNPEDRAKLDDVIRTLQGQAPLLKEVGGFRSDAKAAIFDLAGNAAEWADDDGKGRALGGSADIATGERHQRTPAPAYIGFRVIAK